MEEADTEAKKDARLDGISAKDAKPWIEKKKAASEGGEKDNHRWAAEIDRIGRPQLSRIRSHPPKSIDAQTFGQVSWLQLHRLVRAFPPWRQWLHAQRLGIHSGGTAPASTGLPY